MTDAPEKSRVFVDTNVFLRFLTNDVPEQAESVESLLRQAAAGKIALATNAMVIAELVWVLESHYRLARREVQERAMAVVYIEGLLLPELEAVTDALVAYVEANVDFIDAYNASWMRQQGIRRVYTFDKNHYSRLEGLEVLTP
jgi:uncharacterized protein